MSLAREESPSTLTAIQSATSKEKKNNKKKQD
jgi:hypothetical protein